MQSLLKIRSNSSDSGRIDNYLSLEDNAKAEARIAKFGVGGWCRGPTGRRGRWIKQGWEGGRGGWGGREWRGEGGDVEAAEADCGNELEGEERSGLDCRGGSEADEIGRENEEEE